jgi:cell division protein FtsW
MTLTFARTDTSLLSRWWWTVDRWMLAALGMLVFCGIILVMAASPAVAVRIGLDRFYLVRHHLVLLPIALVIVLGVSLLNLRNLRRLAVIGFGLSLALTALTLVAGGSISAASPCNPRSSSSPASPWWPPGCSPPSMAACPCPAI